MFVSSPLPNLPPFDVESAERERWPCDSNGGGVERYGYPTCISDFTDAVQSIFSAFSYRSYLEACNGASAAAEIR